MATTGKLLNTRDYYDTTTHKLYHFTRTLKLNSCGKGYDISAETRVTIDTAETCDTGEHPGRSDFEH